MPTLLADESTNSVPESQFKSPVPPVREVRVPRDVMLVCAAPVTVAAVPLVLPVTFPVNGPTNPVAVSIPVFELKVRLVPLLGGKPPVAAVTKRG